MITQVARLTRAHHKFKGDVGTKWAQIAEYVGPNTTAYKCSKKWAYLQRTGKVDPSHSDNDHSDSDRNTANVGCKRKVGKSTTFDQITNENKAKRHPVVLPSSDEEMSCDSDAECNSDREDSVISVPSSDEEEAEKEEEEVEKKKQHSNKNPTTNRYQRVLMENRAKWTAELVHNNLNQIIRSLNSLSLSGEPPVPRAQGARRRLGRGEPIHRLRDERQSLPVQVAEHDQEETGCDCLKEEMENSLRCEMCRLLQRSTCCTATL